jgi:hypothetical protein
MKISRTALLTLSLAFFFCSTVPAVFAEDYKTVKPGKDGILTTNGIITPIDLDMNHFYLRNADGDIEVKLNDDVLVGLQERIQRDGFQKNKFSYTVGKKAYSYDLPKELYIRVRFASWKQAKYSLEHPERPIWDGKIFVKPLKDHLPSQDELWLSGKMLKVDGRYKIVEIAGKKFQVATTGHNGQERFMGLIDKTAIKPYIQRAFVYGEMKNNIFHADEICIMRKADATADDIPGKPRVLFIGDSISGNYDRAFRGALSGKANIYHPPVNCGPATNGVENIVPWLGPYKQKGFHWDVISFNFGQWDLAKGSKETYQKSLHIVIAELVKTKAKLIYVTTTPIPGGYGELSDKPVRMIKSRSGVEETWVPGKHKGVMKDYINPWAMEVIKQYPQISICDQHAILWKEKTASSWMKLGGVNRPNGLVDKSISDDYGDNHIPGHLSTLIGRQLARLVLDVNGQSDIQLNAVDVNPKDFGIKGRATARGLDPTNFKDLIHSNERLRNYNSVSTHK